MGQGSDAMPDTIGNAQMIEQASMAEMGQLPGVDPAVAKEMNYNEGQSFTAGQEQGLAYYGLQQEALDAAETPEDVINAIRGNEKPMEARYAELAEFVGEDDAAATPETVLAFMQPTFMMTEQGAVDSGLGQLMQGVMSSGDQLMEDATGATDLGQGVGGLMMQGAGNTPPQNFNQGGPVVRHFNEGGGASAVQLASEMLPQYEEYLGVDKDASQASALFAISRAAANFASGMGPGGQDLRGMSAGAQFAANLGGLAGDLEKIAGSAAEKKQQLKMLALQRAQGKLDKEDERKFQLLLADKEIDAATKKEVSRQNFELKKLSMEQAFRKGEREDTQAFTERQAQTAQGYVLEIERLRATGRQEDLVLANELEQANIRLRSDLTQRRDTILNEYQTALNEDNQTAAQDLARLQAELRDISTAVTGEEQRKTNEALAAINQEYKVVNYGIELDNSLKLQGVKTADELTRMAQAQDYTVSNMEFQSELNTALENTRSSLRMQEQNDAQAHDLAKQAIQNAFSTSERLSAQDAKLAADKALLALQQDFQGTEAEKARAFQAAQNMIANAFKTEELELAAERLELEGQRVDISQGQLDLATANAAADQAYKTQLLGIEREKAKLDGLGKTQDERLLNFIVGGENVEKLKTNGNVSTYFAQLEKFIQPSVDATGVRKDGLSIPENVKAALRERADEGLPMPNWMLPTMYGGQPTDEDLRTVTQNLISPDVNLRDAGGFMSGLASVFNYIGESTVGEVTGTSGTMFPGVKQAQGALDALNAAHRRFILEGRQLAKELDLTLGELPEADAFTTDATTEKKIEAQLKLIQLNIARIDKVITNPKKFKLSDSDASQARQLLEYALQLEAADLAALASFRGETTRASGSIFDQKYKKNGEQ